MLTRTRKFPEGDYLPPFRFVGMIEIYVDFLHMLCAAILSHLEDLVVTMLSWLDGGECIGEDAVPEELFTF
jgi:hypothetical protein